MVHPQCYRVPGEIKRREVELNPQVTPGEIKSREVELNPQVTPGEIKSREVERGCAKVGLLSLRVVPQQQCNGHCPCDCPSTAVETAIAQCTSRWAKARGHRLNTSIILAAAHVFRPPPPPPPVPNKPPRFCGRKATWSRSHPQPALNELLGKYIDTRRKTNLWIGTGLKPVLNWANVSSRT